MPIHIYIYICVDTLACQYIHIHTHTYPYAGIHTYGFPYILIHVSNRSNHLLFKIDTKKSLCALCKLKFNIKSPYAYMFSMQSCVEDNFDIRTLFSSSTSFLLSPLVSSSLIVIILILKIVTSNSYSKPYNNLIIYI